jgi:predicted nucleotidyltransferase component of viral defense system
VKNIEASVRARLKNLAVAQSVAVQRLLTLYMQEGLLHRITGTVYREKVVLKGGLLFYLRYGTAARTTKDIDLHGMDVVCDPQTMERLPNAAAEHEVDDALTFDPTPRSLSRVSR